MKYSVIIPIYNVEDYLERCVKSVINQTYSNLEIILVDDGSTDNSSKICDELKKLDDRIHVLHKKNGGVSSARNDGLKYATGDYISFIDSDDYVELNLYESINSIIKNNQYDIVVFNYKKEFDTPEQMYIDDKCLVMNKQEALNNLLFNKIDSYPWNKVYKKSVFTDILFQNGKNFEDLGTIYKAFLKADSVAVLNSEFYHYLIRGNSITGKLSKKSLNDYVDLTFERYDHLLKEKMCDQDIIKASICYSIYGIYKEGIKFYSNDKEVISNLYTMYNTFKDNYSLFKQYKKSFKATKKDLIFISILNLNFNVFLLLFKMWYKFRRG